MDRKFRRRPNVKKREETVTVNIDFAAETCRHMRGRVKIQCDCIGGELGRISELVQSLERRGLAQVRYGMLDLRFLTL